MKLRAILFAVGLGLAGYLLMPFVALGDHEEPRATPTPLTSPTPIAGFIALSLCSLSMYDFGLNGIDPPAGIAADMRLLGLIDLKYWDTGRVVSQADYAKGLDFRKVTITTSLGGFRFDYDMARVPRELPGAVVGAIFDLPDRSSGFRNNYTGADFEWDIGIQARWGGPGAWTVLGGEYTRERPIPGATVEESGNRISVTVPLRAVQDLGLTTPGVRMVFGSYGPMPERVYDKLPERGSIQLGLVERGQAVSGRSVIQVDLNNDRRDDLWFINATGGDIVQGIAFDRNTNGRIEFGMMEGPVLFRLGASYMDFGRPQRTTEGRRTTLMLENPNLLYAMMDEDRNSDGDFLDAGEHDGAFIPRNPPFWGY